MIIDTIPDSFQTLSHLIPNSGYYFVKKIREMKRIFVFGILIILVTNASAQKIDQKNVPAVVLNAFHLKFPNAVNLSWNIDKGYYHVKFKQNNKTNEMVINDKGTMIRRKQDLYVSEVPQSVLRTIGNKVSYYDIHDADLTEEGKEITYEIKFENKGKDNIFWLDEKGRLLKFRKELDNDEIPAEIVNKIKSRYSSFDLDRAKYLEESKLKYYIIRGEINNYDCIWYIDDKTNVMRYEQDLRNSEIPATVLNSLKMFYKEYEIRDANKIEEDGQTNYLLTIRKSRETISVVFNPEGKILENERH